MRPRGPRHPGGLDSRAVPLYNRSMNPSQPFLEARDFLIAHREDYAAAYAGFRWPQLDRFNWALDYFNPIAQGNDRLALWVVDEHGGDARQTFAALSERSSRVASFLRERGVRRGDRVLVMLGNVVPLWEITLALMKLGAVISPATTLLTPADLQDRIERGGIRHVITGFPRAETAAPVTKSHLRRLIFRACLALNYAS